MVTKSQKKFPTALFTLAREEIDVMRNTLKNISVNDGYLSNISRCVDIEKMKIFGLKSHDCHILMKEFLSLSIRNMLPVQVAIVLVYLCIFFKFLYAKVLSYDEQL